MDLATVGIAFDTSQVQTGEKLVTTSFQRMADGQGAFTQRTVAAVAAQQAYFQTIQQQQAGLDALKASLDRTSSSTEAAARYADALAAADSRAADAAQRAGQAMAGAEVSAYAENATRAAGAVGTLETALGAGTSGAQRLRYSLLSLLDSEVGLQGATGRVVSGLGGLAIGAPEIVAVLAGVAAVVSIYDALTANSRAAQKATEELTDSLLKQADELSGTTLGKQYDELQQQQAAALAANQAALKGRDFTLAGVTTTLTNPEEINQTAAAYDKATKAFDTYKQALLSSDLANAGDSAGADAEAAKAAARYRERLSELHTLAGLQSDAAIAQAQAANDSGALDAALTAKALADLTARVNGMTQLTQGEKDLAIAAGTVVILQGAHNRALATAADLMAPVLASQKAQGLVLDTQVKQQQTVNDAIAAAKVSQDKLDGDSAKAAADTHQNALDAINRQVAAQGLLDDGQRAVYKQALLTNLAASELPPAIKASTTAVTDLANTLDHSLRSVFENLATNGLSSFQDLFDSIRSGFEKLLADMAAKAVATDLAKAVLGGTAGQTQANGQPLAPGSGSQTSGALSSIAPYAAVALGVATLVGSLINSASELAVARLTYQNNVVAFNASLDDFVAHLGEETDSLKGKISSGFAGITGEVVAAIQNAATSPDLASIGYGAREVTTATNLLNANGYSGLLTLIDQDTRLANSLSGGAHDALEDLIGELTKLVPAAHDAAVALVTSFTATVHSELNSSLGATGEAFNTIAGYAAQRDKDLADALTANATTPGTSAALDPTIWQTYQNNVQAFFNSLSTSALDDILKNPDLPVDTLAYAAAIDQQKHAADDAATATAAAATALQQLTDQQNFLIQSYQLQASVSTDPEQQKYLNLAALKIQQDQQRASAQTLLDAGTITLGMFTDFSNALTGSFNIALNSTTGAIVSAAQILSDNASALNAQFDVFQTSAADQLTQLGQLYGFTGLSDATLQGLYTKVTAGQELTDSQVALNKEIQQYLDLERQLNPATPAGSLGVPTTTTNTPSAATASYGPSTPIFQGPVVINIENNINGADAADPQAIAVATVRAMDAALARKATLVAGANGL